MYQAMPANKSVDPIISRLRPRSIGEILDQSFRIYRKYFLTFIAILAVIQVPTQLIIQVLTALLLGNATSDLSSFSSTRSTSFESSSSTLTAALVLYGAVIVFSVISGLLQQVSQGALTAAVANHQLDQPVSFASSYRQILKRIGPLLGAIALQVLIDVALVVPFILLFVLGANVSGGAAGAFICVAFIFFFIALGGIIYISVRLSAITPCVVIEQLGPVDAFRRSWALVQNSWWRTVGLILLLSLLGGAIEQGPAFVSSIFVLLISQGNLVLQQLVSGTISVIISLIYLPIQLIAMTLYYFDLRVRKEGYDLETAMAMRYGPQGGYPVGYGQPPYGQPQYAQPNQYGQYGQYGQPVPALDQYGQPIQPGQYGQTQPTGGYTQPTGGYAQPTGEYSQPIGPYTQPTGGYTPPELGTQAPPEADTHGDAPPAETEK